MDQELLLGLLKRHVPGLLAVYLFGSRASGDERMDSDLDLAVLLEGKLDAIAAWELAQTLASVAGCDVDLVDLRTASTVLQYQILMHGVRWWHKDDQAALYECFILREKSDLDIARAGLLEDIEREGRIYGR